MFFECTLMEIGRPHLNRTTEILAKELKDRPSLIRKLLKLGDPVVSNITYAAIELNKASD